MNINILKKFGFVSIIGLTNVGKSTLINSLVKSKISIVSHKIQTTRQKILGITIYNNAQIVFVDTPGYFDPKTQLDKAMVTTAVKSVRDVNIILLVVDPFSKNFAKHCDFINKTKLLYKDNIILAINKIDLVPKKDLLAKIKQFSSLAPFQEVFLISALQKDGLDSMLNYLAHRLPNEQWMYPTTQISDLSQEKIAAEITREKVYYYLNQELPYAIYIETELWHDDGKKNIIKQVIHVAKENQKSIVLGKNGQKIKQIGTAARKELTNILQKPVRLDLFVRVTKKWNENPQNDYMKSLNYHI